MAAPWEEQEDPKKNTDYKQSLGYKALGAIPPISAAAGGALGFLGAGPVGVVPGGMGGGIAGKSLESSLKGSIYGEHPTWEEYAKELGHGAVEGGTQEMAGPVAGKAITAAAPIATKAGNVVAKGWSAATGVPEELINTYRQFGKQIKEMSKSNNGDLLEMANNLRDKWNEAINMTKASANDMISKDLAKHDASIDVQPAIDLLEKHIDRLNPTLHEKDISILKDAQNKIAANKIGAGQTKEAIAAIGDPNQVHVQNAHQLKEYLRETGKLAYKKPGSIFTPGSNSEEAYKQAAGIINGQLENAIPDYAKANDVLEQLHKLEDSMSPSILAKDTSPTAIMTGGSKQNIVNANHLKKLGEITGADVQGDAAKLAAARTFGKADILPIDTTGKSVLRKDVFGTASSPYVMKKYYDAADLAGNAMNNMGPSAVKTGLIKRKEQPQKQTTQKAPWE